MLFVSDVTILYLAPGSTDNYRELVNNPTTDVITFVPPGTESEKIDGITQVINRIKDGKLSLHKHRSLFTTEKAGVTAKL
jgi:hypothetical protein